jgi:hypothetical protein
MDLPIHPSLLPTLCLAAISVPAAAVLRRTARKEYPSLMPWLILWGALCSVPALTFALLCLPGFDDAAAWLNEAIAGTWLEVLAGIAGVLPGLLWDIAAERIEQDRPPLFGLPELLLRTITIAALTGLLLIPYGFLFKQKTADAPAQTENVSGTTAAPDTAD